jgi:hypothetical protein
VSFLRHVKIYRSDLFRWELDTKYNSRPDHRFDESSTGYSLTGCAPAEPASASPVLDSFSLYIATVHQTAANGNLSLFSLSHQKGALQVSAEVCPGYKYKDDTILFPCISFGPGFEYKQLSGFRDLKAAKQPFRTYSGI